MTPSVPKKLPPEKYRQVVEELAGLISDPVQKLKLLNFAVTDYNKYSSYRELKTILDKIIQEKTEPDDINYFRGLKKKLNQSVFPFFHPSMLWLYKYRYGIISIFLIFSVISGGTVLLSPGNKKNDSKVGSSIPENSTPAIPPAIPVNTPVTQILNPERPLQETLPLPDTEVTKEYPQYLDKLIWLVEKTKESETYSNRLKIITTYTTENIPRRYYTYEKNTPMLPKQDEDTNKVAGILYHASESDIFAFRPEMSESIKEYSRALIKYLSKKKAYHYVIDRFGRVYRLVKEEHTAFHGGNSIWADEKSIYLNLNHAFIGICFEGKDFETQNIINGKKTSRKITPMEATSINEAQLISGKELTDWLRVKYKISQENCVPHSLASLNRHNMLIGHHLDLSRGFPFTQYELSDKYRETIPAMTEFGLTYDQYFIDIFNGKIWPGIGLSEKLLEDRAKEHGMSLAGYRKLLNKRFVKFFNWRIKQEELYNNNSPQTVSN